MLVHCKCGAQIKFADSAFDRGIPTVTCKICQRQFKPDPPRPEKPEPPRPEKPERPEKDEETKSLSDGKDEAGWLVVHDENTRQQTLTLKTGKQIIGRMSELADRKADLMIDTKDGYMSRQHFIITVERSASGGYSYYLSDNSAKNRTLINTKALKKGDEYILKDGDTIQAGLTKIVFKSNKNVRDKREATLIVADQPKTKTTLVYDY